MDTVWHQSCSRCLQRVQRQAAYGLHAAIDEILEANGAFLSDLLIFEPTHFAVSTNENVSTQSEILEALEKDEFIKPQVKEIDGLVVSHIWKYIPIKDLPSNAELINGIWSYHRKRAADKARLCANWNKMKPGIHNGSDIDATYAPVVQWATIWILLTLLSAYYKLHYRQVDFFQASPQANINMPI